MPIPEAFDFTVGSYQAQLKLQKQMCGYHMPQFQGDDKSLAHDIPAFALTLALSSCSFAKTERS
jgi:hypothetical protein